MSRKFVIALCVSAAVICIGFSAWQVYKLQFWRGPDVQFGDQHLKTSVALIELHRVRYGKYPKDLRELTFTGAWDPIAVNSVWYRANESQTRYCVEVERGWIGKPRLTMPPEFWQGTGYDASLCRR